MNELSAVDCCLYEGNGTGQLPDYFVVVGGSLQREAGWTENFLELVSFGFAHSAVVLVSEVNADVLEGAHAAGCRQLALPPELEVPAGWAARTYAGPTLAERARALSLRVDEKLLVWCPSVGPREACELGFHLRQLTGVHPFSIYRVPGRAWSWSVSFG